MSEEKEASRRAAWLQNLADVQRIEIGRHMTAADKARHDAERYAAEIAELRETLQELVDDIDELDPLNAWRVSEFQEAAISRLVSRHGITPKHGR